MPPPPTWIPLRHVSSSTAPKPSPSGEGGPALAGSDEGTGSAFIASSKRTNVAAPHQSKIKDFCQLPPRGKLSLNVPRQNSFSTAVDRKTFPRGEGGSPQARRMRNGETSRNGCTKTKRTHKRKPPNLALPLGELAASRRCRLRACYPGSRPTPLGVTRFDHGAGPKGPLRHG